MIISESAYTKLECDMFSFTEIIDMVLHSQMMDTIISMTLKHGLHPHFNVIETHIKPYALI